jgi:hypothetical protein
MHDNDSITEQFAMNVIARAYKWEPDHFAELVLPLTDLTRTEVTAAHQAFTMWNQEPLSNFSDA